MFVCFFLVFSFFIFFLVIKLWSFEAVCCAAILVLICSNIDTASSFHVFQIDLRLVSTCYEWLYDQGPLEKSVLGRSHSFLEA